MEYQVRLEVFEGPLDLLLYLIEKNKVNIYDIPVSAITEQYLDYLGRCQEIDLDSLADFVVMACTLLSIKSRLLFVPADAEGNREEENDPRRELVQRLLEYRNYKELAGMLDYRYRGESPRVYYRLPGSQEPFSLREEISASLPQLLRAFRTVWTQKEESELRLTVLANSEIRVDVKMEELLDLLSRNSQGMVFQDIFEGTKTRREALAFFLALLELVRQGKVEAVQEESFGRIVIRLAALDVRG